MHNRPLTRIEDHCPASGADKKKETVALMDALNEKHLVKLTA
jgi:hypothetical protein